MHRFEKSEHGELRVLQPSRLGIDVSASGSPKRESEQELSLTKAIGDARNARAEISHLLCPAWEGTDMGHVQVRPSKLEPAQFKAVIEAEYIGCPAPGLPLSASPLRDRSGARSKPACPRLRLSVAYGWEEVCMGPSVSDTCCFLKPFF